MFAAFFLAVGYFYGRDLRRSLRTGSTSYAGNQPFKGTNTWRRDQYPFMYWFGIGYKIFLTLLFSLIGVTVVLYLISGKVLLPGFPNKT